LLSASPPRIPAACPADAVRLLTINVNRLADQSCRLLLFRLLKRGGWDVVVLQETHHKSQGAPVSDLETIGEVAGRALVVRFTYERALHAVASVYAPIRPAGRRAFCADSLLPVLGDARDCGGALLVGGDWICVGGMLDVLCGGVAEFTRQEAFTSHNARYPTRLGQRQVESSQRQSVWARV
jgi:hypothetical protein